MQVPRYWREQNERYNLVGSSCANCGFTMFPRRTLCPKCRHHSVGKLEDCAFSGRGAVETWTVVHQAPDSHALEAPYVLAIVKLDEGPRVTTQIVDIDPSTIEVGMPVAACFRKLGESGGAGVIHYGYKFGPVRD